MARIEEINQSESGAIKKYNNGEAKVVLKEYILNDLKAFEKKWKMRNITLIKVSEEASIQWIQYSLIFNYSKVYNNTLSAFKLEMSTVKIFLKETSVVELINCHIAAAVDLKTSLFEAVKNSFVTVVERDPNIYKVEQRKIVKAKTNNAGDSDFEYIFDVTLTRMEHGIILICYTTKCCIQVQKKGTHLLLLYYPKPKNIK